MGNSIRETSFSIWYVNINHSGKSQQPFGVIEYSIIFPETLAMVSTIGRSLQDWRELWAQVDVRSKKASSRSQPFIMTGVQKCSVLFSISKYIYLVQPIKLNRESFDLEIYLFGMSVLSLDCIICLGRKKKKKNRGKIFWRSVIKMASSMIRTAYNLRFDLA